MTTEMPAADDVIAALAAPDESALLADDVQAVLAVIEDAYDMPTNSEDLALARRIISKLVQRGWTPSSGR